MIRAFFAMSSVLLEREAELPQQRSPFVIGRGRGDDGDVHAPRPIDRVHVDLVENRLLGQPERVVPRAVELLGRQPPEVTDTRQRDRDQPVEELPHPVAAQRHPRTDRHALTQLELGDRLAGPPHLRLLTGDRGKVVDGAVDQLRVAGGVAELRLQRIADLVAVAELEPGLNFFCDFFCGSHQMSLPLRREMRTFLPVCSSMRYPTRAGLPSESTIITFDTWIGASCVTMPPDCAPRWLVEIGVCFLIRLTPSTRTLFLAG